jgi:hypothetical protein
MERSRRRNGPVSAFAPAKAPKKKICFKFADDGRRLFAKKFASAATKQKNLKKTKYAKNTKNL